MTFCHFAKLVELSIYHSEFRQLAENIGGTLTISLSEFRQKNKIGMVGAYRLGFNRGFKCDI